MIGGVIVKYLSITLDVISIFLNIAIIICLVSSFKKKSEETEMSKMAKEFVNRLKLWLSQGKNCRHCCVCCEYYNMCKEEG